MLQQNGLRRLLPLLAGPCLLALLAAAGGGTEKAAPQRAVEPVDFTREVQPLLAERCLRCHGMDKHENEVRLDQRESLLRERDGWAVVVPGSLAGSELWYRVAEADEDERMPPADSGPPLTAEQKDLLRRWIEEGAEWKEHWSFEPARVPELPEVRDMQWPLQDLDRFILARLEAAGVRPAEETDRASWLRRATVFLTGLPPTPEELDAFLADGNPEAFERVADRLLASPRYGEKWARHWLDLVRYAETRGHEFDFRIPNAFEYRDWVVRALNADLPYDQFLTEQIAGDLLEPPRLDPLTGANESIIGTGFWWLGEEVHSPVDLRQDQADRTANKVDVFGKAMLGLTFACARCHDHKFDPIPTTDFYALAGIVQSTSYRDARFESLDREAEVRAELERQVAVDGEAAVLDFERRIASNLRMAALARAQAETIRAELQRPEAVTVFADFEGEAWDGWQPEGSAFGARPVHLEDRSASQGETVAIGSGFVHTFNGPSGPSDELTGTLSSVTFELQHDEMRFLICGGNQPGRACVSCHIKDDVHDGGFGQQCERCHVVSDWKKVRR